jgi:thimet oligopeptidase
MLIWSTTPSHLIETCRTAIEETKFKIKQFITFFNSTSTNNILLEFEEIMSQLSNITTPLLFLSNVSDSPDVVKASLDSQDMLNIFINDIYSNSYLYTLIKNSKRVNDNDLIKRLYNKTLRLFELNGTHLSSDKRDQIKVKFNNLDLLITKFSANLNADSSFEEFTLEELIGVSTKFIESLPINENLYRASTSINENLYRVYTKEPLYATIMETAHNSETRRRMMNAFYNRAPENIKILKDVLILRLEIAKLLGFNSWLEYKTYYKLIKTVNKIYSFMDTMIELFKPSLERDLQYLKKEKDMNNEQKTEIKIEDVAYLFNNIRKVHGLDVENIQEYFPLSHVMDSIFKFYGNLLDIKFKNIKGDVWHNDVKLYEILTNVDDIIGYFYIDLLPRKGKYGHAAAFELISGRTKIDGNYQKPIAAIVANFSISSDNNLKGYLETESNNSVLLKFDEVDTLFHEFGHIMHQTLTKVRYASLSGSSMNVEFVEAPSQMLENFLYEKEILKMMSSHYQTHQPLSDEQIYNIIKFRNLGTGYYYMRQIVYSLLDLKLHSLTSEEELQQTTPFELNDLFTYLCNQYTTISPLQNNNFLASFGHLMEYDGSYYSYLYSEVYADSIYMKFKNNNLKNYSGTKLESTNSNIGIKYKKKILEQGDTQDFPKLVKNFLGYDVTLEPFIKIHEL